MSETATAKTKQDKQKKRPYYGGGMPKGHKGKKTLDKEVARARLRELVMQHMDPMVEAQIANAQGIKYLVARDKKGGKFKRMSEVEAIVSLGQDSETEIIEVWEKDPSVQAFTDLLNRTLDKPIEQVDTTVRGTLVLKWQGE